MRTCEMKYADLYVHVLIKRFDLWNWISSRASGNISGRHFGTMFDIQYQ